MSEPDDSVEPKHVVDVRLHVETRNAWIEGILRRHRPTGNHRVTQVKRDGVWQPDPDSIPTQQCRCGGFFPDVTAHIRELLVEAMTIEARTQTELGALPIYTVIRDTDGTVLERWGRGWYEVANREPVPLCEIVLPATVLWMPTDDEQGDGQ